MKALIKITTILSIIITLVSCGKEAKKEEEKTVPDTNQPTLTIDLNKTENVTTVVFTDDKINDIYAQYLEVKGALVNTDARKIQKEAKKLDDLLAEGKYKELKATAKLIGLTKEVKKQRDFFVTLTLETEKIIDNAAITSGEVYKQFCPMAFDGKGGYWLSNSKEVRNPYFGDRMLKCGSVKATIN